MLNFNQFVNESKDHDFDSLEAGDKIQVSGKTSIIKKVGHGIIHIPGKDRDMKISKSQWNQGNGRIIKKREDQDDKK